MTFISFPPANAATGSIIALMERYSGQQVAASRTWRVEAALKQVLSDRNYPSVEALAHALKMGFDASLEQAVVEALLNHETSFFRDGAILDNVIHAAAQIQARVGERRLRIWSAGCSTGQEPLSLAMLFAEAEESGLMPFPEILATDMSAAAVNRARSARYSQFEVQRGLPIRLLLQWFEPEGSEWVARRDLIARLRFRQHNLATDTPPPGRFDLILCRNVLIYFAPAQKTRVLNGFARMLRPEGLLLMGAGETVIGQSTMLEPSPDHRGYYRAIAS